MGKRSTGVTVADVRAYVLTLPRAYEVFVRGRIKFRVGQIVFVAFSRDETIMGFGFPKEWRQALVENEPEKFMLPGESDMRFHWACVRLDAIDEEEMRELVLNAWAMVVPKYVSEPYALPDREWTR
ncbi:MAG: MmcQ/YjbR family DNA-binding protein [Gaiellaceae bacterium]